MDKRININQASRTLKNISNESRLKILFLLDEKPMSVSLLNRQIKISQSALSQHLNMLKLSNIIDSKRQGTNVTYAITSKNVKDLVLTLKELYGENYSPYNMIQPESIIFNDSPSSSKQ